MRPDIECNSTLRDYRSTPFRPKEKQNAMTSAPSRVVHLTTAFSVIIAAKSNEEIHSLLLRRMGSHLHHPVDEDFRVFYLLLPARCDDAFILSFCPTN